MEEINSYWLYEIAKKDWISHPTVKKNYRYIPVRFYTATKAKRKEQGIQSKDYTVKYIRLEDIKKALKGKVEFTFIK